jgi:RNA polymerase sigma-70 factor, ECF subfamily
VNLATADTSAIWSEFGDGLKGYIQRRVGSPDDAEDILQDVFVRIHVGLRRVDDRERLAGWIYRITANAITDFYRKRARAGTAAERLESEARVTEQGSEPAEAIGDMERDRSVARYVGTLVDALPAKYREAVRLTELDRMTRKEAAARAGISESGMKSRVQRGRAQLKDALLECCAVELDRRKGIIAVRERGPEPCGCDDDVARAN